jgi:hypothetical protein
MTTDGNDPRSVLDKATDAVLNVTESVQTTTDSIAGAIEDSRRSGGILNQLARFAREAPLGALAIAFLVGSCLRAVGDDGRAIRLAPDGF